MSNKSQYRSELNDRRRRYYGVLVTNIVASLILLVLGNFPLLCTRIWPKYTP